MDIDAGDIRSVAWRTPTTSTMSWLRCALLSALAGLPPDWYKSRAYRSRTVREPRKVLAEFGTDMPDDIDVRVHVHRRSPIPRDPKRPEADDMSEEELATLVTRDSMIGVSVAIARRLRTVIGAGVSPHFFWSLPRSAAAISRATLPPISRSTGRVATGSPISAS